MTPANRREALDYLNIAFENLAMALWLLSRMPARTQPQRAFDLAQAATELRQAERAADLALMFANGRTDTT